MARFPIDEWQAEQIRLTVFPIPGADFLKADWWRAATGSEPEETTSNPKKLSIRVEGMVDDGKLILQMGPDRIDWLLVTLDQETDALVPGNSVPTVGRAIDVFPRFSKIAKGWLTQKDLPAITRMAFGAVLFHPEPTREDGYLRLPDYVPVRVDPNSSDFLYQINLPHVPTTSAIEGLYVNRLSKWSVLTRKAVLLTISGSTRQSTLAPDSFALRGELDINTAASFTDAIPSKWLTDTYYDLEKWGLTLAEHGVAEW